jgi:hypothetical protein
MFVSDRLVYLQMQKTASTHIAKTLAAVLGGDQHVQHQQLDFDPGDRLVVASIRSPWSWYVSLWAYGCRGGGGRYGLYNRVTAAPPGLADLAKRSFVYARAKRRLPVPVLQEARQERAWHRRVRGDLWRPVYTHPDDVDAFRGWIRLMFDPERADDLPGQPPLYGQTDLRFHSGFMTFRYFTLLADDRAALATSGLLDSLESVRAFDQAHTVHDDVIRIECLESELRRVLSRAGYELSEEQSNELHERSTRKTNESPHLTDADYFDEETSRLVGERERFLVEKYGYSAPV